MCKNSAGNLTCYSIAWHYNTCDRIAQHIGWRSNRNRTETRIDWRIARQITSNWSIVWNWTTKWRDERKNKLASWNNVRQRRTWLVISLIRFCIFFTEICLRNSFVSLRSFTIERVVWRRRAIFLLFSSIFFLEFLLQFLSSFLFSFSLCRRQTHVANNETI